MNNKKRLRERMQKVLKKYDIEDMRIEVTDTHGKMFTSNWTTEVKSYLIDDILEAAREMVPEKVELDEFVEELGNLRNSYNKADGWNKCIEEIESKLDD